MGTRSVLSLSAQPDDSGHVYGSAQTYTAASLSAGASDLENHILFLWAVWSTLSCTTMNTNICHRYFTSFVLHTCLPHIYCWFKQKRLPICKGFARVVLQPRCLHLLRASPQMAHLHFAPLIAWHSVLGCVNNSSQPSLWYELLDLWSSAQGVHTVCKRLLPLTEEQ